MTLLTITPATPADLPAILALLNAADLPEAGLANHLDTALVARSGDTIVGSAALEIYGAAALLRSVAVAPTRRGQGVGRLLTAAALELARCRAITQIYLLTTTAETYFPAFGFTPISRAEVDPQVQQSVEFTSACPASAAVLVRELDA